MSLLKSYVVEPTDHIIVEHNPQFFVQHPSCEGDVGVSGKYADILKTIMNTEVGIKTHPGLTAEIERMAIHFPTSEGVVRISPEKAASLELEVLPLMYRNGHGKHKTFLK